MADSLSTLQDSYILGCLVFQIIMAIESAISAGITKHDTSVAYDTAWGIIFMFAVGGAHAFFIFLIVRKVGSMLLILTIIYTYY